MSFDELAFKANLEELTKAENEQQELAQEFYKKALAIKGIETLALRKSTPIADTTKPAI